MIKMAASLVIGLMVVGCGNQGDPLPATDAAASVTTIEVRPAPVELAITAVGTLQPVAKVLVAAQEEGLVTAVHVREGDRVAAGDVVVELDDREILAELAEARANLDEAAAGRQRVESLHATGLSSPQELDAAVAKQRVAAARADALETRLSFTRITAPVAGVVTSRQVEVGDLASPRAPLLELASGRGLLLRVPVSELEVVRLHTGDPADVSVDALPGQVFEGRIQRIFPAADSVSRQVTVELMIDDTPPAVRYGFLARARLVLERIPDALVVPETALQRGAGGGTFVWVVEDGTARMREVTVGHRFESQAVVTSGLAGGEPVVLEGVARLSDGVAVTVQPAATGAAS
jgi:membrane fusion protein (multidrug efflux system)